ncbi:uncharacterized protein LOC126754111 [Bactrocera neohumeralis]|uniref:uncharacterized protein LOC126754111 n=1 Tax=Bactrocera neohumeralis TaxID=98809 RepID=UPI0021664D09|nr:uncharacterized protein LOC126754111 [Bactrocera neohumeralis]
MKWLTMANMQSPITLISLLAVVSGVKSNASISSANKPSQPTEPEYCNSTTQAHMWGDVNPNIFYICDESTNATRQMRCPAGRGFFRGRGYFGCIPYADWPACLDRRSLPESQNSGSSGNATVELCKDEMHLQQTWAAVDPNKFYMCQSEHSAPLLLNCEAGKGYVSAWTGEGGGVHSGEGTHIVGCAAWEKWRMYMHCTDFY